MSCNFAEQGGPDTEPAPVSDEQQIGVDVSLYRRSPVQLIVALRVRVGEGEGAPFTLDVIYAGDFRMSEEVPEDQRDEAWKRLAFGIAPNLLYPYVREAITNLTSRWRGDIFTLPLVPLPLRIPETEQIVPPPPSGSEFQGELPLRATAP